MTQVQNIVIFDTEREAQNYAYNNRWHPIDEELPKVNSEGCSDYILLSFDNFTLAEVGRYEEDKDGNGAFYVGDDDKPCSSFNLFVNAWRPLPKRYEGVRV
jgi:hypothetical protein